MGKLKADDTGAASTEATAAAGSTTTPTAGDATQAPTQAATDTAASAEELSPATPPRRANVGDPIHLVHADKSHFPAVVDRVDRDDNSIDCTFADKSGGEQRMTKCPFDPTAVTPDSWHFPEE